MKRIIKLIILIIISLNFSLAQVNKSQVLVRGTVTDLFDNSPMQVEVRFEDPSGKYFKINSNSLSGRYEQVLNSNTQYKVRLFSNQIFPTYFILVTPDVNNYTEIEQNYKVIRLDPGRTALVYDLFPSAKSDFNSNLNKVVDELNVKTRFNRNVKIKIEISGVDSKNIFTKLVEKKVKKKIITETKFEKKEFEDMVNKRFETIKQIKTKLNYPERITFDLNLEQDLNDKLLSECPDCDTRIIVTEYDPAIK